MNFAALPDPVATARGSDTPPKRLGYKKPHDEIGPLPLSIKPALHAGGVRTDYFAVIVT
jgi:hypothetical protein